MSALDLLAADDAVGVDGMAIAKALSGLLTGAGGAFGAPSQKSDSSAVAAELLRLQQEKRSAEESAATTRNIAIGVGVAAAAGAVLLLLNRKRA